MCFPGDRRFWPFFPRIFECDKSQGTVYKGPQDSVTITAEILRLILQDIRGC